VWWLPGCGVPPPHGLAAGCRPCVWPRFSVGGRSTACHGVAKRRRVKLPTVGGRMCFCLKRTLRCLKYKNWLLLLAKTNYIVLAEYDRLESLCRELRITLISSINTAKGNIK